MTTLVAAILLGATLLAVPAAADDGGDDEALPQMAFVVNAFDFPDPLAAGAVAGSVGAPVVLTPEGGLDADAQAALQQADPDLVVVVGGTAVVSEGVEDDVTELGYDVERVAGAQRTETAAELVDFAESQGFDRPVVTGREVEAGTVPGLDAETLQGSAPDDLGAGDDVEARLDALEADNEALREEVDDLTAKLDGVERTEVDERDTLRFEEMNLQVVDGSESTDGESTGLGNLVIGYHSQRDPDSAAWDEPAERDGAHHLIVGDEHEYTGYGGIVAGFGNTASGSVASVIGGAENEASGIAASVTGGFRNEASGNRASVTGGSNNEASDRDASVTGGSNNTASEVQASVTGGRENEASANQASVTGGRNNEASGLQASVTGGGSSGGGNTASGNRSSILGGDNNEVDETNECHPDCE